MEMKTAAFCTAFLILALAGCSEATGPTVHETQSVAHDTATTLRADIHMSAGTLRLAGGSTDWLNGDFAYNVPEWKPKITYTLVGAGGDLRVEQPGSQTKHSNTTNEWNLHLNDDVATDLKTEVGAGESFLNAGTMNLRSLSIEMGAGTLNLDLRGHPKRSYELRIRGGVGDAKVFLPASVGLYLEAAGGIGDVNVQGLRKENGHWINDLYGTSPIQIHADIKGGVGGITVNAE
jgi:hypothetical protein